MSCFSQKCCFCGCNKVIVVREVDFYLGKGFCETCFSRFSVYVDACVCEDS